MNIKVLNEYITEVELTPGELMSMGITYEELDYGNINTRRFLWTLKDRVKELSGVEISLSGRLLIEAMQQGENILLRFSRLGPDSRSLKQLIKSENRPVIADFSDIDKACLAVHCIKNFPDFGLYEKDGIYRLVFHAPEEKKNLFCAEISEFGEIAGESFIESARTEEMWNFITKDPESSIFSCALRHS